MQKVELHPRSHHQRGEAGRRQQQPMQPIAFPRRPSYAASEALVILERGSRNRGIRFRHDSWMGPERGIPSLMLLHGRKTQRKSRRYGLEAKSQQLRAKSCSSQSIDCSSFPGLNRTALPGGMDTSAPVRGLRPMPGLARTHVEHAKAPQLNAIAAGQRLLHALEYSFHGQFGLGLGDAGLGHHFVDNVELNHKRLPDAGSKTCRSKPRFKLLMLRGISEIVNGSIYPVNWHAPSQRRLSHCVIGPLGRFVDRKGKYQS